MRIFLLIFSCFFVVVHATDGVISTERPAQFNPSFEVASCYCEYKGKVLLLLRNKEKPQGNKWCVPGGKLDKDETARQALKRELKEEIGWEIAEDSLTYCSFVYVKFPETEFVLHLFKKTFETHPPALNIAHAEHSDYKWVSKEEIDELPLIPGGKKCFNIVKNHLCSKSLQF